MARLPILVVLGLLTACELGPPLPPRAEVETCRPLVDGAPVATLSETGCFPDLEELTPAPDLIPYAVRSALWTDGAHKERWVVVPPGATLGMRGDELLLPDGTILIKLFELANVDGAPTNPTRMEVRFLVLEEGFGWRMFTYRFDEDGLEARLLEDGEDVELTVDEQPIRYHFPDRVTCGACHFSDRPVLGFSAEQLNFRHDYGPATENQLLAMRDIGLLEMGEPVAALPHLVEPSEEDENLEERARSWLHANCAHCHRPGGWASSSQMNLRSEIPFGETGTCGEPTRYYGLFGPDRIIPGDPERSGLYRRLTADGLERMPPVGVSVTDPTGRELVRRWIASLEECPPE